MYIALILLGAASVLAIDITQEWISRRRKRRIQRDAFPFMKLPAELRAEVFSYLIDPLETIDANLIKRESFRDKVVIEFFRISGDIMVEVQNQSRHLINALHESPTRSLLEYLGYDAKAIATQLKNLRMEQKSQRHPVCRHLNNMRLVNKQFSKEFFTTYLIHAEPIFTVESSSGAGENPFGPWQHSLALVKKCTLRLIAQPSEFNPMHAKIDNWPLRDAILDNLHQMNSLRSMTLNIEACGNQLWNPVQLWYFCSQGFKKSDVTAFKKIKFTMKNWKLNESNHMLRTADGGWEWRCVNGHFVVEDERNIPIRSWAVRLYKPCSVCGGLDESEGE